MCRWLLWYARGLTSDYWRPPRSPLDPAWRSCRSGEDTCCSQQLLQAAAAAVCVLPVLPHQLPEHNRLFRIYGILPFQILDFGIMLGGCMWRPDGTNYKCSTLEFSDSQQGNNEFHPCVCLWGWGLETGYLDTIKVLSDNFPCDSKTLSFAFFSFWKNSQHVRESLTCLSEVLSRCQLSLRKKITSIRYYQKCQYYDEYR